MMKKYEVVCGDWRTIIEATNDDEIFSALEREFKKILHSKCKLWIFISVNEIGNCERNNVNTYIMEAFLNPTLLDGDNSNKGKNRIMLKQKVQLL